MMNNPFSRAIAFRYVNDANATISAGDGVVAYKTLTAARTIQLPPANAFDPSQELILLDASGSCSGTNTLTIAPSGTDNINGANSTIALSTSARSWALAPDVGSSSSTTTGRDAITRPRSIRFWTPYGTSRSRAPK